MINLILAARDAVFESMRHDLRSKRIDPFDTKLRRYLIASMGSLADEHLRILFLDSAQNLIADEQLQQGTLSMLALYPRVIFRRALEHNAAAIILVHNHPSGNSKPSQEDISATRHLDHIGRALGVELLDHIVVTANDLHHIMSEDVIRDVPGKSWSFTLRNNGGRAFPDKDNIVLSNARSTMHRLILRRQLLGARELFGEPAWDMLLDLFIHECENRTLSMFSMCAMSGIPMSSAMRLSQKLCDAGLLCRVPDPNDGRRSFMTIDPEIAHRMRAYFSEGVE